MPILLSYTCPQLFRINLSWITFGWPGIYQILNRVVRHAFAGTDERPARRRTKFNKLLTDEAAKIAKAADCSTILVFTDGFPASLAPRMTFPGFKVVLAGEGVSEHELDHHRAHATLAVRALSNSRLSQASGCDSFGTDKGNLRIQRPSLLRGRYSARAVN